MRSMVNVTLTTSAMAASAAKMISRSTRMFVELEIPDS